MLSWKHLFGPIAVLGIELRIKGRFDEAWLLSTSRSLCGKNATDSLRVDEKLYYLAVFVSPWAGRLRGRS